MGIHCLELSCFSVSSIGREFRKPSLYCWIQMYEHNISRVLGIDTSQPSKSCLFLLAKVFAQLKPTNTEPNHGSSSCGNRCYLTSQHTWTWETLASTTTGQTFNVRATATCKMNKVIYLRIAGDVKALCERNVEPLPHLPQWISRRHQELRTQ